MDDIDILSISLRICITLFAILLILVEFPNLFPCLHHNYNNTDVTEINHGERREKRRRQQQQRCNNNSNSNNSTHYLGGNRGSSSRSSSINSSSSTTSLLQRATDAEISINKQQRYDAEMNRLLPAAAKSTTTGGGGDTKVIDVIVHDGEEIIGRHRRNVILSSPPPQKKVVNESSLLLSPSSYSTTRTTSTTSFKMKTMKKLTTVVKIPPLYIINWIPRGILYIFLGLITLQQSIIVLAQDQSRHASISSRLFDGLFVLISGYFMLGVGCMYVLFGMCCLQPIMERVRYDDNVRWTKYYMLLDEMEDELQQQNVDEEQREKICCCFFNYKRWYRGYDRCKKQWNRTGLCFEFRCRPIKCKW
jgi:hypothetical protein